MHDPLDLHHTLQRATHAQHEEAAPAGDEVDDLRLAWQALAEAAGAIRSPIDAEQITAGVRRRCRKALARRFAGALAACAAALGVWFSLDYPPAPVIGPENAKLASVGLVEAAESARVRPDREPPAQPKRGAARLDQSQPPPGVVAWHDGLEAAIGHLRRGLARRTTTHASAATTLSRRLDALEKRFADQSL